MKSINIADVEYCIRVSLAQRDLNKFHIGQFPFAILGTIREVSYMWLWDRQSSGRSTQQSTSKYLLSSFSVNSTARVLKDLIPADINVCSSHLLEVRTPACGCLGDSTTTAYANDILFYTLGTKWRKMSVSSPPTKIILNTYEFWNPIQIVNIIKSI